MIALDLMDGKLPEDRELAAGSAPLDKADMVRLGRCASLSEGQLAVLRLVNQHLSSKEIGVRLGISSHTVDQRVRGAIKRLGVQRRSEAARLVAAYDAHHGEPVSEAPYQRLIHQLPDIDPSITPPQIGGAVSFQIRHADRTGGVGAGSLDTEQGSFSTQPLLFLPWSTPRQPINRWGVGRRLAAIAAIAIGTSFAAGMFLAGLESLARLVQP